MAGRYGVGVLGMESVFTVGNRTTMAWVFSGTPGGVGCSGTPGWPAVRSGLMLGAVGGEGLPGSGVQIELRRPDQRPQSNVSGFEGDATDIHGRDWIESVFDGGG